MKTHATTCHWALAGRGESLAQVLVASCDGEDCGGNTLHAICSSKQVLDVQGGQSFGMVSSRAVATTMATVAR